MNTDNSANIRKDSKSFLNVPFGTRRSYFMKNGDEKSHDTVPLNKSVLYTWACFQL
jgi:hypothetical protein